MRLLITKDPRAISIIWENFELQCTPLSPDLILPTLTYAMYPDALAPRVPMQTLPTCTWSRGDGGILGLVGNRLLRHADD